MKKRVNNYIIKILALCMGMLMCLMAIPVINWSNMFATAENVTTNVAYFEGYGMHLNDEQIHAETRIPSYTDKGPALTFFVHGQSGSASHWSNDGNGKFEYDSESLIEKLRDDAGGADVYWARMSKNGGDKLGDKDDIFETVDYEENRFFLTKLNAVNNSWEPLKIDFRI